MIKSKWNDGWEFINGSPSMMGSLEGDAAKKVIVQLPHDAMVHEERTPSSLERIVTTLGEQKPP